MKDRLADTGFDRLPAELVDRLTESFSWFLRIEAFGGGILLMSTVTALALLLGPAALYRALQLGREGAHDRGTIMATDTAFVIGCLSLLGRRIPQNLSHPRKPRPSLHPRTG
jgi:Na+/H+ antiporter NhaA